MRPEAADLELVGEAVRALRSAHALPGSTAALHPGAAAVRTSTGRVVTALGLAGPGLPERHPEPAAVAAALALGEAVVRLVAVRHVDADSTRVSTPCSACRAVLLVHAPAVRVVHLADGLRVAPVGALPPATG